MWKLSFTLSRPARRVALWSAVVIGAGAILAGCGSFRREQRAEWRDQAEASCIKSGRVRENQYIKISKAIDGPGVCGANYPMKVAALATPVAPDVAQNGNLILTSGNMMLTSITPTATLACPMVSAVDDWLASEVQAAAMTWFGQPVIELITFGSFACRPMNHRAGARLSEHSFANAIDAKAFKLADGRTVSIVKGWRGAADEQGFLREVTHGACKHFTTVLAPGSDALHYDHLHMDLARHNAKGDRRVCRPRVDMPAPPSALPQDQLTAEAPLFKPAPAPPRAAAPGQYQDADPGALEGEIEDLRSEPNFNSRYFDVTGSVTNPNDPPVLRQRPGPPRRKP